MNCYRALLFFKRISQYTIRDCWRVICCERPKHDKGDMPDMKDEEKESHLPHFEEETVEELITV
jgi:hypothetical protein